MNSKSTNETNGTIEGHYHGGTNKISILDRLEKFLPAMAASNKGQLLSIF
jgi:hypothetical protein